VILDSSAVPADAPGAEAARAPIDRAQPTTGWLLDLARIFRGFGPLPAVAGTREQTGAWDHTGASRTVVLADGSTARERLTTYVPPHHFAYRLDALTGPLRLVAAGAEGAWWFAPTPRGTRIRWTYVFEPRGGRAAIVRLLLAPLWRSYQRRALALAAAEAEAAAGRTARNVSSIRS